MLTDKVRTALWYVKRPSLYQQFAYVCYQKAFCRGELDTHRAALEWCEQRALDTDKAIEVLTGEPAEGRLADLRLADYEEAQRIASECPVQMGGPGDINLLYHLVKRSKARKVIETGVAYGWSALAILAAMEDSPDGVLISSDMPYVRLNNDAHVGCVVFRSEWRNKWELVRRPDRQVLPYAIKKLGTVDLCHYDSDKSASGRSWAYPRLWAALRPGGFLVSDDIHDNVAFRDFALELGITPIIVRVLQEGPTKYAGVLQRPESKIQSTL